MNFLTFQELTSCLVLKYHCIVFFWLGIFPTAEISAQTKDSAHVWNTLQQSLSVIYAYPDSAESMILESMELSRNLQNDRLLARSYNFQGILFDVKGLRPEALEAYGIARRKADSLGDQRLYASAVNNIGLIQWQQGDYVSAVKNFQESLLLFEEISADAGVANTLNNIGLIYTEQQRLDEALLYFRRAQRAFRGLDDEYGRSAALMNISRAYEEKDMLDSAVKYISKTLEIKRSINDPRGIAMCYANLGVIAGKNSMLDSSIYCFEQALRIDRENGFDSYVAQHLSALGQRYVEAGRYTEAEEAFLEGLVIADSTNELKPLWGIHSRLADFYASQNQYQRAYYHANQYASLYVQWRDEEREQEVIQLEERFDVARKETELAKRNVQVAQAQVEIEEQQRLSLITILSSAILFVLLVLGFRKYRQRQEELKQEHALHAKLQESEFSSALDRQREGISRDLHDSIGSRLTFLSSTLKNLTWALKNQKRPGIRTLERLDEVSGLAQATVQDLRDTVWAMNRSSMSAAEIVLRLEYSTHQWKEAFEGIELVFQTDEAEQEELKAEKAMAMYRIGQEALTNVRKHASAKKVLIYARRINSKWELGIEDDGVGFDTNAPSASNGLSNMAMRAQEADLIFVLQSSENGTRIAVREK